MKILRFLLSSFCVLSCITLSKSQITIDANDFGNQGDTVLVLNQFQNLASLNAGNIGANQVWDFSALEYDSIPDTLFFQNPSNFPQASQLPGVNIVIEDALALQFYEKDNNGVYIHGVTIDFDTFLTDALFRLTPKAPQFRFPMSFGGVFNSTHTSNGITIPVKDTIDLGIIQSYVDSVRVRGTFNKVDSVNGYGTLILPNQIRDVLRQSTTLTITPTVEVLIPNPIFPAIFFWFPVPSGTFPDIQQRSLIYIGKGAKYPLLNLTVDSTNSVTSVTYQFGTDTATTGLAENFNEGIKTYPNPVNDQLIIENEQNSTYFIRNLQGSILQNGLLSEPVSTISTVSLPAGIYMLQLLQKDGKKHFIKLIKS